jgi:lysophospholipid acyltransferase (LPLAT)-like uncharacterized protein
LLTRSWKRLGRHRWVQMTAGVIAAEYLRFVFKTTRELIIDPPDGYARIDAELPVIIAMWHGQHFLGAFARRPGDRGKALISRHRDAEINAIAAERLGIETIRGSGDNGAEFLRKGGVGAFRQMLETLQAGESVALTADVPKIARRAGRGIVMLARESGRPIFPIAIASSRRYVLNNWDHTTINLPFGRAAAVCGEPVRVPEDADDATLEVCRRQVEDNLNAVTTRAYALVDGKG